MTHLKYLRWGLLGTGRINQAVIGPIRKSKNSQLMAVASRNHDKVEKYANTWKIPHFYTGYDALISDPNIDVIYNSLPNRLHAEWSIKAIEMGKHVLCEKPITTSATDVDKIINAANKNGIIIAEAFMYRHHPQTLYVKKLVENGEIGEIQFIHGSFCYSNTRSDDPRFNPNLGGGSLWDVGCYPIGYSRYLIEEEPNQVFGHQVIGSTGIDLLFAGQLNFPCGVIAQIESSFVSQAKSLIDITGKRGRIIVHEPYKPGKKSKIVLKKNKHDQIIEINGADLYQGEIEDLENAILSGESTRISLEDSRANIFTIEALYKSAKSSKSLKIHG